MTRAAAAAPTAEAGAAAPPAATAAAGRGAGARRVTTVAECPWRRRGSGASAHALRPAAAGDPADVGEAGRGRRVLADRSAAAAAVGCSVRIAAATISATPARDEHAVGEPEGAGADVRGTAAAADRAAAAAVEASASERPLTADVDLDRVARGDGNRRRRSAAESRVATPASLAALRPVEVEGRLGDPEGDGPGLRRSGVVEGLGDRGGGRGERQRRERRHREDERGAAGKGRATAHGRRRHREAGRSLSRIPCVHEGLSRGARTARSGRSDGCMSLYRDRVLSRTALPAFRPSVAAPLGVWCSCLTAKPKPLGPTRPPPTQDDERSRDGQATSLDDPCVVARDISGPLSD